MRPISCPSPSVSPSPTPDVRPSARWVMEILGIELDSDRQTITAAIEGGSFLPYSLDSAGSEYARSLGSSSTVFGMDAFADLFLLRSGGVVRMDTETGDIGDEWAAPAEWLRDVRADPDGTLGCHFLAQWELSNGKLRSGHRLTPRIPFVLGGCYRLDNIVSVSADEIMAFRSDLACQIRGLPHGTRVLLDTA